MVFWLTIAGDGVEVVLLLWDIALLGIVIFLGIARFFLLSVGVRVPEFFLDFLTILCLIGLSAYGVLIMFHLFKMFFSFFF